jgi:tetratricopeptide (TPR) repeat protein
MAGVKPEARWMAPGVLLPLLVVAAVAPYVPLLLSNAKFVFDDNRFIERNPAVTTPRPLTDYFTDPATVEPKRWQGIWRPLRTLDFMVDWRIAGGEPPSAWTVRWYHLRSLAWHAATTLLLVFLLRRWGAAAPAAALGAAVFALHPVQVESVAFITSRGDLLCGFFFLAALLVHRGCSRLSRRALAASGLLALALLSKEVATMFVPAAVLTDFLFFDGRRLGTTLRRWPVYLLYGLLSVAYVLVWLHHHRAFDATIPGLDDRWGGSFAGLFPLLGRSAVYYLRLLLLPVDMALDFYLEPIRGFDPAGTACLVLLLAALALSVRRVFRGEGRGGFALLWATILLVPTSHLVATVGIPTAERFLYLPMAGVALWAGGVLHKASRRGRAGIVLALAVLACLFVTTTGRALAWTDIDRLWAVTLERVRSPRALQTRASTLRVAGEDRIQKARDLAAAGRESEAEPLRAEGEAEIREAFRLYDEVIDIWTRLFSRNHATVLLARAERSLGLFALGRHEETLAEADAVLAIFPSSTMARYARSLALYGRGELREAAELIEVVLEEEPTEEREHAAAGIYEKLAKQYNAEGNRARTVECLRRSFELLPDPAENRGVRAALDAIEADFERTAAPLRIAVRRAPGDLESWLGLASVYAAFGRYREAGEIFDRLLAPGPAVRTPEVLFPYALYFWQWRDTPEGYRRAAAIYEEILRRDPGVEEAARELRTCRERLGGK